MDKLVQKYEVSLVERGCAPGSGLYGLRIELAGDISDVLPYLNAVARDCYYDHENHILIRREADQVYAFRPREVRVARIEDASEARQVASDIIEQVNAVWRERHKITPRFARRKLPAVMDLLRLLPRTNCKRCGYATCLAYVTDLRNGQARIEDCAPVANPEYAENRRKLLELLA